jgi:hypothetical protein
MTVDMVQENITEMLKAGIGAKLCCVDTGWNIIRRLLASTIDLDIMGNLNWCWFPYRYHT